MENAAVEGLEYQRGTLFDYEVKEYLLEKYHYSCVYCGVKNVPFEKSMLSHVAVEEVTE